MNTRRERRAFDRLEPHLIRSAVRLEERDIAVEQLELFRTIRMKGPVALVLTNSDTLYLVQEYLYEGKPIDIRSCHKTGLSTSIIRPDCLVAYQYLDSRKPVLSAEVAEGRSRVSV